MPLKGVSGQKKMRKKRKRMRGQGEVMYRETCAQGEKTKEKINEAEPDSNLRFNTEMDRIQSAIESKIFTPSIFLLTAYFLIFLFLCLQMTNYLSTRVAYSFDQLSALSPSIFVYSFIRFSSNRKRFPCSFLSFAVDDNDRENRLPTNGRRRSMFKSN